MASTYCAQHQHRVCYGDRTCEEQTKKKQKQNCTSKLLIDDATEVAAN